jgi:hypothetical protein
MKPALSRSFSAFTGVSRGGLGNAHLKGRSNEFPVLQSGPFFGRKRFEVEAYGFPDIFHGFVQRPALGTAAIKFRAESVVTVLIFFDNGVYFVTFHKIGLSKTRIIKYYIEKILV